MMIATREPTSPLLTPGRRVAAKKGMHRTPNTAAKIRIGMYPHGYTPPNARTDHAMPRYGSAQVPAGAADAIERPVIILTLDTLSTRGFNQAAPAGRTERTPHLSCHPRGIRRYQFGRATIWLIKAGPTSGGAYRIGSMGHLCSKGRCHNQ